MQLKVGSYYKNSLGTIFGPVEVDPVSKFFVVRKTGLNGQELPSPMFFHSDGSCVANATSAFNLVELVKVKVAEVAPALAVALANGGPMGTSIPVKVEAESLNLDTGILPVEVWDREVMSLPDLPPLSSWEPPPAYIKPVDYEEELRVLRKDVKYLLHLNCTTAGITWFKDQHPELV